MKITLKKLTLVNFKAIKSLTIDFHAITNISGQNGTGKTTICDAFTWLLFGKDSSDKKDFNIKTLDSNNSPIHKLDHEVTGVFDIDGIETTLRRVYREKWVKTRGKEKADFTGHETLYYCNEVPMQQAEYNAKVDKMLSESIAKLVTSPQYFNTMKWQDRRATLSRMAGDISNEEVLDKLANKNDYAELMEILDRGKSFTEYKVQIASQKKKLKDALAAIPARIDEIGRSMPEPRDYKAIENTIAGLEKELTEADRLLHDRSAAYEKEYQAIQRMQQKKHELSTQYRDEANKVHQEKAAKLQNINNEIGHKERSLKDKKEQAQSLVNRIDKHALRIISLKEDMEDLRLEWGREDQKVFVLDENKLICPTCKRGLESHDQEEIKASLENNFNTEKQRVLAAITDKGRSKKQEVEREEAAKEEAHKEWQKVNAEIETLKGNIESLKVEKLEIENTPVSTSDKMDALKAEIDAIVIPEAPVLDANDLKTQKADIQTRINAQRSFLAEKEFTEKLNVRKKEVEDEERSLSSQLAGLEKTEFLIEAFNKQKVETIEQRINGMFKVVKFKMFDQQLNGGEVECCECMVNGVPYSDVNTAGKINAGIDIINALCRFYHVNAPIWIDNRESINDLIPCDSQIINLIVSREEKLTIK